MHIRTSKATLTASGFAASLLMSTGAHAAVANGLIAYPCETGIPFETHQQNICLINPDGTGKEQITFDGDNALPSWSPDGKMLAYTNFQMDPSTGAPIFRIFVMDIEDRTTAFLTPGVAPAWSPDGSEIAFTAPSETSPDTAEIWSVRPDGTDRHQLTDAPGLQKIGVTWAPDSQSIAYTQSLIIDPAPPPSIHNTIAVTDLVTNDTHELITEFGCGASVCFQNLDEDGDVIESQPVLDAGGPAWSPTGNPIIFFSGLEGGRGQIWKIDSDGTGREQLTFPPKPPFDFPYATADDPAWSPDGTKILFSTNRTVREFEVPFPPFLILAQIPELWVMDADGSNPHPIVENTFGPLPGRAAWQPLLVPAIAEPASLVLLGGALLGFGLIRRRNRTQTAQSAIR